MQLQKEGVEDADSTKPFTRDLHAMYVRLFVTSRFSPFIFRSHFSRIDSHYILCDCSAIDQQQGRKRLFEFLIVT